MSLVIIGSGGHAGVVIGQIRGSGKVIVGCLDDFEQKGVIKHGVPVLGKVMDWKKFPQHMWFNAVGDNNGRFLIASLMGPTALNTFSMVSSMAYCAGGMEIGLGTFIAPGAVVAENCSIGKFSIINTNASLDHDSVIGDYSHLAPGAVTGGHVRIGHHTMIGIGAMIRDHTKIGNHCFIGMGSVVTRDVPDNSVGYGNPWKLKATI